jgi:hypothetical protein
LKRRRRDFGLIVPGMRLRKIARQVLGIFGHFDP